MHKHFKFSDVTRTVSIKIDSLELRHQTAPPDMTSGTKIRRQRPCDVSTLIKVQKLASRSARGLELIWCLAHKSFSIFPKLSWRSVRHIAVKVKFQSPSLTHSRLTHGHLRRTHGIFAIFPSPWVRMSSSCQIIDLREWVSRSLTHSRSLTAYGSRLTAFWTLPVVLTSTIFNIDIFYERNSIASIKIAR